MKIYAERNWVSQVCVLLGVRNSCGIACWQGRCTVEQSPPPPFPQPHSRNNNPLPVSSTIHPSSVFFQQSESLYSELFQISSKTQLLSNSWASKPVIDPITMWLLFHPYFKCRTFSDCSSAQNGIFSSRLSCLDSVLFKKVQKPQEVHQLSSNSSFNSAIPVSSCKGNSVTLSSRKLPCIQASFGPYPESKCFQFLPS